jgi:hypothetical protein
MIEVVWMNVKTIITAAGMSLTEVAQLLSDKYKRPYSVQNLNNKIRNKTLRLSEAEDIADITGFDIVWKKKNSLSDSPNDKPLQR